MNWFKETNHLICYLDDSLQLCRFQLQALEDTPISSLLIPKVIDSYARPLLVYPTGHCRSLEAIEEEGLADSALYFDCLWAYCTLLRTFDGLFFDGRQVDLSSSRLFLAQSASEKEQKDSLMLSLEPTGRHFSQHITGIKQRYGSIFRNSPNSLQESSSAHNLQITSYKFLYLPLIRKNASCTDENFTAAHDRQNNTHDTFKDVGDTPDSTADAQNVSSENKSANRKQPRSYSSLTPSIPDFDAVESLPECPDSPKFDLARQSEANDFVFDSMEHLQLLGELVEKALIAAKRENLINEETAADLLRATYESENAFINAFTNYYKTGAIGSAISHPFLFPKNASFPEVAEDETGENSTQAEAAHSQPPNYNAREQGTAKAPRTASVFTHAKNTGTQKQSVNHSHRTVLASGRAFRLSLGKRLSTKSAHYRSVVLLSGILLFLLVGNIIFQFGQVFDHLTRLSSAAFCFGAALALTLYGLFHSNSPFIIKKSRYQRELEIKNRYREKQRIRNIKLQATPPGSAPIDSEGAANSPRDIH